MTFNQRQKYGIGIFHSPQRLEFRLKRSDSASLSGAQATESFLDSKHGVTGVEQINWVTGIGLPRAVSNTAQTALGRKIERSTTNSQLPLWNFLPNSKHFVKLPMIT